jgi:hypothetical protein
VAIAASGSCPAEFPEERPRSVQRFKARRSPAAVDRAAVTVLRARSQARFEAALAITKSRFGPGSDFTSLARLVEDWAGVQTRG